MLYPKFNKSRKVFNLNGIWDFAFVEEGYVPSSALAKKIPMAVPGSVNELTTNRLEKNHVGVVVYEKVLNLPIAKKERIFLRIGAACHICKVYIDGEFVTEHNGGFLPLDVEISKYINKNNRLTIVLDNRLSYQTLPIGEVNNGKQTIHHDFYNYFGIHRDVVVYTTPKDSIKDIFIESAYEGDYHKVFYRLDLDDYDDKKIKVEVIDENNEIVAVSNNLKDVLYIENPILWNIKDAHLYRLHVTTSLDEYEEIFGIRKVEIKDAQIYLNDKKVYLKGFGKHEDFPIVGKANISAVNIRDYACMDWIGANSFRTSHYPYAEEMYDLADKLGYLVIDEVPAVGFNFWNNIPVFCDERVNKKTLEVHKAQVKEMINRDKNHPCIISYSLANEATTWEDNSRPYFEELVNYTRTLTNKPLTIVENNSAHGSRVAELFDIIGVNKYNGWYIEHGNLNCIHDGLKRELTLWYEVYKKPLIVTEFGADTIEGNHYLPSETFSEEFQVEFLDEFCKVFDELPFVCGEHVWNFADFKTKEGLQRVRGNRKGVFTRDRQPKMSAHYLKHRWNKK